MEFNCIWGVFFYSAWSQCQMIAKLSPPHSRPACLLFTQLPTLGRVLHHIRQVVVSVYLIIPSSLPFSCFYVCIQPVQEKYAQLAFNEPVTLLPSLGLNDQPVQYSVVHPSTKGPPPHVPSPHSSSQPPRAPEGDKHPLGSLLFFYMQNKN